jgi:hypothetical protein
MAGFLVELSVMAWTSGGLHQGGGIGDYPNTIPGSPWGTTPRKNKFY